MYGILLANSKSRLFSSSIEATSSLICEILVSISLSNSIKRLFSIVPITLFLMFSNSSIKPTLFDFITVSFPKIFIVYPSFPTKSLALFDFFAFLIKVCNLL